MNIEFYKMFVDVVRYKSITKAATEGNLSQSALSQQIKVLEKSLNIQLFERTHKGVELTESGSIVYKHALNMTASYDQMMIDLINLKTKKEQLHLIATPIVCSYALPCTLYHIKDKFPSYIVNLETMASSAVEKNILQGIGDIGIIAGKPENDSLIYKKVYTDKYFIVASINMQIPSTMPYLELYKYPTLMLSKTQKTRKLLDNYFLEQKFDQEKLNILFELDSIESIKMSVLQGYGLAFLPYMSIKKELYNKQLKIVSLTDFDFSCDYCIIKRRKDLTSTKHSQIISYIEKMFQEIVC